MVFFYFSVLGFLLTELSCAHRMILLNTGNKEMVSHISHSLPGKSSMMIIRTFSTSKGNQNNPAFSSSSNKHSNQQVLPAFSSAITQSPYPNNLPAFSTAIPQFYPNNLPAFSPASQQLSYPNNLPAFSSAIPQPSYPNNLPAFSPTIPQSTFPSNLPAFSSAIMQPQNHLPYFSTYQLTSPPQQLNYPGYVPSNKNLYNQDTFESSPKVYQAYNLSAYKDPGMPMEEERHGSKLPTPYNSMPLFQRESFNMEEERHGSAHLQPYASVPPMQSHALEQEQHSFPQASLTPSHGKNYPNQEFSPATYQGYQNFLDAGSSPPYPLSPDEEEIPGPFAPRYEVGRWEISEDEAKQEIKEEFENSGLYPGFFEELPGGLVNINYGLHGCVHLGTYMDPEQTKEEPTRVSFPATPEHYYTLVLVDVESRILHWFVANIPGGKVKEGNVISEYQPPSSGVSSGSHRYTAVALKQKGAILYGLDGYSGHLCDWENRNNFDIKKFADNFDLELAAANFFTTHHQQKISEEICKFSYL